MKRFLASALILGLLLVGCGKTTDAPPTSSSDATESTVSTTTTQTTVTTTTTATAPSDPVEQTTVTVYILDRTVIYDSGFIEYAYDPRGNLDHYTVMSIENEIIYTCRFENRDENGMPQKIRNEWDDGTSDSSTVTYSSDGKPQEILIDGSQFGGYQYAYDQAGNMIEKRCYDEGILVSAVYYQYQNGVLTQMYGEDVFSETQFECVIKNGRVTEKVFRDADGEYRYVYDYDDNGNIISERMIWDGETIPVEQYYYRAIEVDAASAPYAIAQQRYLISIL
ncbi:MAG: hypothetical protein IKV35_05695 [Clostridia bacterium]|nr:hypothetical protein [Clostridia bacterium]